jgi:hypothetical protein
MFRAVNPTGPRADISSVGRVMVRRVMAGRVMAVGGVMVALALAGCGGGDVATDGDGRTVVTAPSTKAGNVVDQQNQQLQQMEQQTSQADPTVP